MEWRGRSVLVTGASSGIGRMVAVRLAGRGATVGLLARSQDALDETAAQCRAAGGRAVVLPADVTDRAAVEEAVRRLDAQAGLDAVVHAAGVVDIGAFEEIPSEVFDAVLRTNLGGTVVVLRAVLPSLRRSHGVAVVIGSLLGEVPSPLMSAYVSSKHAVHGLVRTLQAELGPAGPRLVLVQPSAVRTPIYVKAGNRTGWRGAPMPPVVEPATVARAVLAALEEPRRTVRVGALVRPAVALHRILPGAYAALARQAAQRLGLDRGSPLPPTDGAVLEPRGDLDAVVGPPVRSRWRSVLLLGRGRHRRAGS